MDGEFWSIIVIVGPILLLAPIVYGWWSNRKMSNSKERRSDAGVRELRREIEEEPEKRNDL